MGNEMHVQFYLCYVYRYLLPLSTFYALLYSAFMLNLKHPGPDAESPTGKGSSSATN